jgi:predicted metal-dependent hydrolase
MTDSIHHVFDYKIVYSARRSIGISVGPNTGVTVRAPYRTSLKTIEALVASKSAWIIKHLENYKSTVRINNGMSYSDGSDVMFHGRNLKIRISESKSDFVRPAGDFLEIGLKNVEESARVGYLAERWLRKTAETEFKTEFEEILTRYRIYNFKPAEFCVRSLKRRWGSCSSKGKITISSELVKLDEIYLEYVILHELCHLRHHNHGKDFYRLLSEVFPDWKRCRVELKKYVR